MKWFIFNGGDDTIFPPDRGMKEVEAVFDSLSAPPEVAYNVTAEGVEHVLDCRFIRVMMAYIINNTVTEIDDYELCEEE